MGPWIIDQRKFSAFVSKYRDIHDASERDRIDILIELGFLENEPDWLTPHANSLIDKYYPGYRESVAARRHGENEAGIQLAAFYPQKVPKDGGRVDFVLVQDFAQTAPPLLVELPRSLFSASSYPQMMGFLANIAPGAFAALARNEYAVPLLTAAAVAIIIKSKEDECSAVGGCGAAKNTETIVIGSGNAAAKPCITISGKVIPIGSYALVREDTVPPSKPHFPIKGNHWHYRMANQGPKTGRCFWNGDFVFDKPVEGALPFPEEFQ